LIFLSALKKAGRVQAVGEPHNPVPWNTQLEKTSGDLVGCCLDAGCTAQARGSRQPGNRSDRPQFPFSATTPQLDIDWPAKQSGNERNDIGLHTGVVDVHKIEPANTKNQKDRQYGKVTPSPGLQPSA
jgi:hypothetical protein